MPISAASSFGEYVFAFAISFPSFVRSFIRSIVTAYLTHMRSCVNVRSIVRSFDPPIVRSFKHSFAFVATFAAMATFVVLRALTTRDAPLPTHEGGIDVGQFLRGAKREGRLIFSANHIHVWGRRVR